MLTFRAVLPARGTAITGAHGVRMRSARLRVRGRAPKHRRSAGIVDVAYGSGERAPATVWRRTIGERARLA